MLEKLVQVVAVSSSYLNPTPHSTSPFRALCCSYNGYFVPSTERTERLRPVSVSLSISEPSTSSPSPSLSPPPLQSRASTQGTSYRPVFPRSNILVMSDNSILSLLPSTFISRAEALIDKGQVEEAVDLANEHRRKLEQNISHDEDKVGRITSFTHGAHWCLSRRRNYDTYISALVSFASRKPCSKTPQNICNLEMQIHGFWYDTSQNTAVIFSSLAHLSTFALVS